MGKRIKRTFARLKDERTKAFIPYVMAGDGGLEATQSRVLLLEKCGADIVELGVPFSDPLADGPTIQAAAERALKSGVTLRKIFPVVKELRAHTAIPLVLMLYYNLILRYDEGRFVDDARQAGIDGIIVPDLPPEEARNLIMLSRSAGIATIFLVAPTSTGQRMKVIARASRGFIYYVSMTGITGTRLTLETTFHDHIRRLKEISDKPVAVGFGISSPEEAAVVAQIADGVIVGSAIVKKFHEHPQEAEEFLAGLRKAIQ
jgi:tryptophan synthase alpha chain